ncbi:MAG: PadR family transcriptional regulator [Aphanocapsa lilacina HA4352-LM1]|jgi:DNA-binding PadR family transcriptional regulator|nr:PadR family transcriptional regulator [Aphanocapsa lilacina HA4352-LM1]
MGGKNKSKFAILGLLSLQPMSGYDIRKKIAASIGHFWSESYGQIYPILRQLVQEGLATRTVERQEGKPDRYVYALTDSGRKQLIAWLQEPVEPATERNELLLKLFFGRQMSPADCLAHLRRFRWRQEQQQGEFLALLQMVDTQFAHLPDAIYWHSVISYGLETSEALMRWCDKTASLLEPHP